MRKMIKTDRIERGLTSKDLRVVFVEITQQKLIPEHILYSK